MAPVFSLIIPTRNRAHLLVKCLDSILVQTFDDYEVVIVDDGSEDDTRTVVEQRKDSRIRYYYQEYSERSAARNVGIDKARGKYICFIDDDDLILPDYLKDFNEHLFQLQYPILILRTGFIKFDGSNKTKTQNYQNTKHKNPINFILHFMCGVGSLCIPSSLLETEKFAISFPHWQDTHLFVRLLLKADMIQLDSHNYLYRIHEEMGSRKAFLNFNPVKRAELNVLAMEDLFEKYHSSLHKFIPNSTLDFLRAKKYLEYATSTLSFDPKSSRQLRKMSFTYGIKSKLWKHYIYYSLKRIGLAR